MAIIRLISTDLDGTLLGGDRSEAIPADVIHRIAEVKAVYGALWVINTGRQLRSLLDGPFRYTMFRVFPDYLVVRESEIYRKTAHRRYRPLRRWNRGVRQTRKTVIRQLRPVLRSWHEEIIGQFPCHDHAGRSSRLWFRSDADVAIRIEEALREKMQDYPEALVYRNGTDVYLGFTFFTKGAALGEIALLENCPREQIFAVGDGPNDISMLDGNVAAWCATVANADPSVIEQVRRANGYVTASPFGRGVVEALDWAEKTESAPARTRAERR